MARKKTTTASNKAAGESNLPQPVQEIPSELKPSVPRVEEIEAAFGGAP